MSNKYYNTWGLTKDQLLVKIIKDIINKFKNTKNVNKHTK